MSVPRARGPSPSAAGTPGESHSEDSARLAEVQAELRELQQAIEALAGQTLHKPNFRRLIEQQDLVEETGDVATETGGRPAKLFRFRRDVVAERAVTGSKLPLAR